MFSSHPPWMHLPHHTFPLGKRFGFHNPNLYLSPFLSFTLDFLWNSVNSQTSLMREGDRLLGVSSLCRDWWGSCMDMGNEWEDIGVEGGVLGTSWYDTLSALILVMTQHLSLVWRMHSFGVHLSQNQNAHCLQHLQQQHEQQMLTMNTIIVNITLPHVVVNTLKC